MNENMSFLSAPKIAAWINAVKKAGCSIRGIKPRHLYYTNKGELLFALLSVDAFGPGGTKLPSIIFIRGHACIIVPLLINKETKQTRFLMVKQRRISSGEIYLEFPAGMLDDNISEPEYVAIKEMFEETGIQMRVTGDDDDVFLFPLNDTILYSSPGASDEGIYFYGCIISVDSKEFHSFEGQVHGNPLENERTVLTLKTKEEVEKQTASLQCRLGLYLFENYCASHDMLKKK